MRNKIRVILLEMEREHPGILDNFTEEDINEIPEIKKLLAAKRYKIKSYSSEEGRKEMGAILFLFP